jgi:hypothetical protein
MLRSIPTVSAERLDVYFDTIDAKLGVYENLLNEASSLFPEQFGLVEGIVLNILSFTDCDDDIETIPLADASLAMVLEEGLEGYFVYYDWMENEDIPMEVTHIRVHSSVRAIQDGIFCKHDEYLDNLGQLATVILNDKLEEIGCDAFRFCESLEEIVIPNNVKTINDHAFRGCTGLTSVILGSGLKEIGEQSFLDCVSLERIVIPNAVKTIKDEAFYQCSGLTAVTLGDGLEEIGMWAFWNCSSLEQIVIPPTVKRIRDTTFEYCTNLTCVKFCDEIEEFMSCEAMRGWWNQGAHEKSLSTYSFLVRCCIPKRFSVEVSSWQANIYNMLSCIPTISHEGINAHFDTIDAKLAVYKNLLNETHVLFPDQFGLDDGIVLNIQSFL